MDHRNSCETDVTLLIGDKFEVRALKCLLAAYSPVFQNIFNETPQLDKFIVPSAFSLASIETIVSYSFGENLNVKTKDLLQLRAAASYYKMDALLKYLDKKVLVKIHKEKYFCLFFHWACKSKDYTLVAKCLDLLEKKLDHSEVILSKYFICLDYEPDLCLFFRSTVIKVDPAILRKRLQDWAEYLDLSSPDRSFEQAIGLTSSTKCSASGSWIRHFKDQSPQIEDMSAMASAPAASLYVSEIPDFYCPRIGGVRQLSEDDGTSPPSLSSHASEFPVLNASTITKETEELDLTEIAHSRDQGQQQCVGIFFGRIFDHLL